MMTPSAVKDNASQALRRVLLGISPLCLVQYQFRRANGRWYYPRSASTFDEKLLWLMLYWRHPLKARCADKYGVRSYVQEHGLGHLLPGLLGVYSRVEEIDFDALPERFVLKATHGCGFNLFCTDKSRFDAAAARDKLNGWLKTDISRHGAELHYASIPPRIICETFLDDGSGGQPSDYKIYCFEGNAHCTMACTERTEAGAKYDFYDLEWKNKLPYSKSSALANRTVPKPEAYDDMIVAAQALAKPFPFVRVDFYSIRGRAVFGEMTFTPHGCIDPGLTPLGQETMGRLIRLPAPLLGDGARSSLPLGERDRPLAS